MTDDERTPFDDRPDAADRAWLRDHLDPIVGSPDLDDAAGATPVRMPVAPAPAGARQPARTGGAGPKHARRALAVAAAVAVLVGAGVVVRSRGGDAGDGADVAAIAPEPTGWYVPVGLPDGWTLLGAEHWAGRPTCERRGFEWSDAEAGRAMGLGFDACGTRFSGDGMPAPDLIDPEMAAGFPTVEEVDLGTTTATGPAFDGELRTSSPGAFASDQRMLTWEGDGGVWTLRTLGLTEAELLDAARTLAADPDGVDAEAAVLGVDLDLDLVERWEAPARIGSPEVQLSLRSPDGRGVGLHLTLPGDGVRPAGDAVVVAEQLAGQPNEVLLFDDPSWAGRFGARWPGADLTVFRWEQDPMQFIDDDQLRTLLAALRPAGATDWRAFLSTATGEVSPPLLEAPTLAALLGVEQEAPAPPPTEPAPSADTSPEDPAAPDDGSGDAGDPAPTTDADLVAEAALVPSDGPLDSFSDLTGLEVRLSLADAVVTAQPGGGDALVLRNRTDAPIVVNECSTLLTTWGLVPRGADGPLPRRTITDCYDNSITTVPAHGVAVVPLEWGADRGFVARSADESIRGGLLGTLPAGAYDAVVEVPTANGTLRARVPVQVLAPACPMSDDDALRYRGLRVDDAREAAAADGLELVVVFEDGVEGGTGWDLDCTRLRAVVSGGVVDDYTFG